jgi:hypothetical protein
MRATGARGRRPSPYPRPAQAQATPRRNNRRRYVGGLSALAIAAAVTAGFMSTSTAIAEEGGADTVTFNGNCGIAGLLNKSTPDKTQVAVVEGDKVTFVNNLGSDATLHVGQKEYDVDKGDRKAVTMSASSEALMSPHCPIKLSEDTKITTLNVSPAEDNPAPGDGGSGNGGSDDGSGSGSDNGSGNGDGSGNGSGDNSDNGEVGVPNDGNKPGSDNPAAKGQVPDPKDGDKTSNDTDAANAPGDTSGDDGSTTSDGQVEAANTVAAEQGASGMLAILATVCLAGVAVAAVRTMVTNRAAARA